MGTSTAAGKNLKLFRFVMEAMWLLSFGVVNAVIFSELANMRIGAWTQLSLVILGLLIGFTSVLYNRARALPAGRLHRRTIYAGELVLRAAVLYLVGMMLAALIHYLLWAAGYKAESSEVVIPRRLLPIAAFFIPNLLMLLSFMSAYAALRVLLRRGMAFMRPIKVLRRVADTRARQ